MELFGLGREAKVWIICKGSWQTFKGFCPDVIFQKQNLGLWVDALHDASNA